MPTPMRNGQLVTREVLEAAMISILPLRDAVKVAAICGDCGAETTTWLRPADETVPYVRCNRCYDAMIHELESPTRLMNQTLYGGNKPGSSGPRVGAARRVPMAWTG